MRKIQEWQITDQDRLYLRELAKKQAEYAALPIMREREKMWYAHNDGLPGARPPIVMDCGTFSRDFMPPGVLRCESKTGQGIEAQMLRHIRNFELIHDDQVVPDSFAIGWFFDVDEMGIKIEREYIKDSQGIETGYREVHPIKNLQDDFHLLKPAVCRVDREKTMAWKAFVENIIGDILPVQMINWLLFGSFLTQTVVHLMGMEEFYMAMYSMPDELHRLMAYLRDNALRMMHWAEDEQLLFPNNNKHNTFGGSNLLTHLLPGKDYAGGPTRIRDCWGVTDSQETVGISPEMFHEFCFPYYRDLVEPMGLVYYGCCEPAHPFWNDLKTLPRLKKISISRWCDQRFMGDALRGSKIVFSRKPDPNFLSVGEALNEEDWSAHIRETLEATKDVFVEFIVRDVYTVHGNLGKPRRAVELARREIDRLF